MGVAEAKLVVGRRTDTGDDPCRGRKRGFNLVVDIEQRTRIAFLILVADAMMLSEWGGHARKMHGACS